MDGDVNHKDKVMLQYYSRVVGEYFLKQIIAAHTREAGKDLTGRGP